MTEVFHRRERDGIDPFLDHGKAKSWKAGYPASQRSDEIAECAKFKIWKRRSGFLCSTASLAASN